MKSLFLLFFIIVCNTINLFGFDYGGFHLDDTIFQKDSEHQEFLRKVFIRQIDEINSVQLPSCLLDFFHRFSITGVIDYTDSFSFMVTDYTFAGRYTPSTFLMGPNIDLNAALCLNPSKGFIPGDTLLHEFMHLVHDTYAPSGFINSEIIDFYNDAKKRHCYGYFKNVEDWLDPDPFSAKHPYRPEEYLFYNYKEFFACTAVAYLGGKSNVHPFSREEIQEQQPKYYAFLQKFFDPNSSLENSEFNPINNWHDLESSTY